MAKRKGRFSGAPLSLGCPASALPHRRSKQTRRSRQTRREASLQVSFFRPVTLAGTAQRLQSFRSAGQLLCSFCGCQREIFDQQDKIYAVLLGLRELTSSRRVSDQSQGAFLLIRGHVSPGKSFHTHRARSIACALLARSQGIRQALSCFDSLLANIQQFLDFVSLEFWLQPWGLLL